MKTNRFHRLMTAAACAPLAALTYAEPPKSSPPSAGSGGSSRSVSTSVTNGKGTITVIVERDGKKEVRTLNLDSDNSSRLAEQLLDEIKAGGDATSVPAKKQMTYLGVMLAESSPGGTGGGGFGDVGGGGFGSAGSGGAGSSDAPAGGADAATGLPAGTGLTITGVSNGSPAEKAGLKGGDVLAKLDDQILVNPSQFTTLIRNKKAGETIKLALMRNGEAKDLEVTLATREAEEPSGFGYGGGGVSGAGQSFFRPDKKFPGGSQGRVLRLEKDGKILEEWVQGDDGSSRFDLQTDKLKKLHEGLPQWEKTLRDAAGVKDQAAEQWKKQLAEWREQWTKTQEKTASDYRRAMEKMGEEIRKAGEAAQKAQEEARRAIEAWKEKRTDDKSPPPAEEKKDPEQPKKA